MNKKRIVGSLLATAVLLGVYGFFIVKWSPHADIRLVLDAKFYKRDNCRLYVGNDKPLKKRINPGKEFQQITFFLPRKELSHVRLSLGKTRDTILIGGIKLKNLTKTVAWPGSFLKSIPGQKLPQAEMSANGDILSLGIRQGPVILPLGKDIIAAANLLAKDRTPFILVAIPLGLLIFLFCYYFTLSRWRLFAGYQVSRHMVLIFLVIILIPLVTGFINFGKKQPTRSFQEKRIKASKPEFRLDAPHKFSTNYKYYYNDHFVLRNFWIYLNNFIKVRGFGVSPLDKVTLGKDDWLFMARNSIEVDESEYYRGIRPFSFEEMEQWRITLEQRRDWLSLRGIHYLFIMVPNKSTVYPEFMPSNIRKVNEKSRWDQLFSHLRKYSNLAVLDLKSVMSRARKNPRIYRKGDTHWNQYGAFIAYSNIIKTLAQTFQGIKPMPLSDFNITYKYRTGGDLAIMLSLQKRVLTENVVSLDPKKKTRAQKGKKLGFRYPWVRQSVIECPTGELPTTLMIHDSFANRLKPYLSEHFSRIIYFRDWRLGFFPEVIKKEQVKLVIDQTTERFLMSLKPKNPAILKKL